MQRARIASQTLGLISAAAVLAAAQSASSQPDALDLLKNVEATYSAMGTYSARSTNLIEMNGANLQNKMEMSMTIAADSSGRFRMESKGMMGMLMVFDGSTMWIYMPQTNQYSKVPHEQVLAAATPEGGVGVHSEGAMAMFGSFANPFHGFRSIAANLKEAKVLRSEKLHVNGSDVDCWVVSVEYESATGPPLGQPSQAHTDQTAGFERAPTKMLWVDKTRYLVYQEDSTSKMTMPGANETMNIRNTTKFDNVTVDELVSPDVFTFTPPPGATEMDSSKEVKRIRELKKE